MDRHVLRAVLVFVLALGASIGLTSRAQAYTLTGCHFSSGNIGWSRDSIPTGNVRTALPAAPAGWNPTDVNLTEYSFPIGAITASVYQSSSDGLDGRSWWSCGSNKITTRATVQVNTTNAGGLSLNRLRAIWTHEFGHALGLGHRASNQVVMYSCARCFYDATGYYTPRTDDRAGVNYLY